LPLISASWCHPYKTPAVVSQHIWTPFSNTSLFHLGNILMAFFAMFIRDRSHVCRKKNPNGNTENEVSMTCYTPKHSMMKIAAAAFLCTNLLVSLPIKLLQMFSNAFQALLSTAFNFIQKSWLFNLWTNKNPFFHLSLNYFGKHPS
jgi:hypothetical protein